MEIYQNWGQCILHRISSFCLVTQLCPTLCDLWTAARQISLSFTISQSLLKLMSIESVIPSNPISSSVTLFSFCPQSFPASGSFSLSQFIASGGQSIGASASASVHPMNIQDWFPLGWTGLNSLLSTGLSRAFSNTTIPKHQFFRSQPSLWSNSHIHTWLLEKPKLWLYGPLSAKLSLLFDTLSGFVIAFLPRSKHLLISWLQSPSAVILEPKKIVFHCSHCFPIYIPWSGGTRCHDLSFWMLSFKLFHSPLSPSSRGSLVPLYFLP